MTINKYKQQKLLMHDVTKNLINTKWKLFGNQVYFYNLGFYCCFLAVLTTNVMTSIWPQKYPALFSCSPYFDKIVFTKPNQTYVLPDHVLTRRSFNYVSRAFIWGFVILRLVSIAIGHELSILLKVGTIFYMGGPCHVILVSPRSKSFFFLFLATFYLARGLDLDQGLPKSFLIHFTIISYL